MCSLTTTYSFDPLDRTARKTVEGKTTDFTYLGLSSHVLHEEVAGQLRKSYQYSPWGERLSHVTHNGDGTTEDGYYGYNGHTDVETLTDKDSDTKATYGYTAYGADDKDEFTGIDKPDAADPTKEAYNPYRFNAKRWDAQSGTYDMGFRDYSPGLNRFTTRDMYNGALAGMGLGTDPFTGNRYAFAGGNPISGVELDGHRSADCNERGVTCTMNSGGGGDVKPTEHYTEGAPSEPPVQYADYFPYDPNASAGIGDWLAWTKWGGYDAAAFWGSVTNIREVPDGELTYRRYRGGTGADFDLDYESAYREDGKIRGAVDNEIAVAQKWVETLYARNRKSEFSITGGAVNVGGKGQGNYPETKNWQKAIGEHKIWGSANITVSGNKVSMDIVIHAKDRYDFNDGSADIVTGEPNAANGRFAVLGWAKPFMTYGTVTRNVSWTLGQIPGTTNMSGGDGR